MNPCQYATSPHHTYNHTRPRGRLFATGASVAVAVALLITPGTAAASPRPVPTDVSNCAPTDYQCGYLQGQSDGQTRRNNGQCGAPAARYEAGSGSSASASEQGYTLSFNQYCPS
jgi:hypothetical protein